MKTTILLFYSLCIFSCTNQSPLEKEYKRLMHSDIVISNELPFIIDGKDTIISNFHTKKIKCVMYVDSTVCNVCNMDKLLGWMPLIEEYKKNSEMVFYFIFEPKKDDINEIKSISEDLKIGYPIVVDTLHLFEKHNSTIAYNKYLNVFLLHENKVVFIGNPIYDKQLNLLFRKKIKEYS